MIVRNEEAVIRRCLESVKLIIDYWIICDTGSTDGTQQLIKESLDGIPGTLHEVPWVDFGRNRTIALQLARGKADYHLLVDADMIANIRGEFREKLTADAYLIRSEGPVDYYVERLVSDRHQWRYVGATHECICSETARTKEKLHELSITHFEDGGMRADKFQRDIGLLKKDLETDPNNARCVFYLAQTYRDLGNLPQAIEWYEKRASMNGWAEEVWYSMYQIARLQHRLELAWPFVLCSYLAAYQFRPTRLEPLFHVAKFYRENQQYQLGYLFSRAIVDTPYPDDILFIEKSIYGYQLPQEYAICCYWIGKHKEAVRVNDAIIACCGVPENYRETAIKNRELSLKAEM